MSDAANPSRNERLIAWLRSISRPQAALLGVAAVMLALALVVTVQAQSRGAEPENLALVDAAHTDAVGEVVARGLTQVLSYDHLQPEATQALAAQVLDGQARTEYDTLFAGLQERAQGQKLVYTVQVQAWAMQELTASTAELLVFLDQTSTREGDDEASVTAAQLAISAEKRDSTWVITGLKAL